MPCQYFENICTQVVHAHLRRSGCTWQTTAVNAACSSQGSSQTAIRQMGSVRVGKVMNEACSVTTLAFPATPIQHAWNLSLPWGTIRIEIFPPPTFGDFVHLASPANMDYLSCETPMVSFIEIFWQTFHIATCTSECPIYSRNGTNACSPHPNPVAQGLHSPGPPCRSVCC